MDLTEIASCFNPTNLKLTLETNDFFSATILISKSYGIIFATANTFLWVVSNNPYLDDLKRGIIAYGVGVLGDFYIQNGYNRRNSKSTLDH